MPATPTIAISSSSISRKWPRPAILIAVALAVAGLVGWVAVRLWPRLVVRRGRRRAEQLDSEAAWFGEFERACAAGDALAAYAAMDGWSRRAGIAPLAGWLERFGDPSVQCRHTAFERFLFGPDPTAASMDLQSLRRGISSARQVWMNRGNPSVEKLPALPELNP